MSQFAPKSELFNQFRLIFKGKESGMLTLLTDNKKSLLMRFSDGQLTSSRCRSWDIANTVEALLESESVKFSYIRSGGEDKPALMDPDDFMMMIDPGGPGLFVEDEVAAPAQAEPAAKVAPDQPEAKPELAEVAEAGSFKVDRATSARMNYF